MFTRRAMKRTRFLALAGVLALGVAACEDDPTEPDDHADPVEVRLMLGATELARAGVVGSGLSTGEVSVAVGEETAHIDVEFLDEDGDVVQLEDEFSLGVEVADASVADFEQDTPGEFGGHVHGEAVGTTTMVFEILHGDHADWVSEPVTVEVVAGG